MDLVPTTTAAAKINSSHREKKKLKKKSLPVFRKEISFVEKKENDKKKKFACYIKTKTIPHEFNFLK